MENQFKVYEFAKTRKTLSYEEWDLESIGEITEVTLMKGFDEIRHKEIDTPLFTFTIGDVKRYKTGGWSDIIIKIKE